MTVSGLYRGLTPEQALDEARAWATATRRMAAKAEDEFAEAITRYNQAGGEHPGQGSSGSSSQV